MTEDFKAEELIPTPKLVEEGEEFLQKAGQMETEICDALDLEERKQLWKLERKLLLHLARGERGQIKTDRRLPYSEKSYTAARNL